MNMEEQEAFIKRVTGITDLSTIKVLCGRSLNLNYTGWAWWHESDQLVHYTNGVWHRLDGPAWFSLNNPYTDYDYHINNQRIGHEDTYWTHPDVVLFRMKKKLKVICDPSVTD